MDTEVRMLGPALRFDCLYLLLWLSRNDGGFPTEPPDCTLRHANLTVCADSERLQLTVPYEPTHCAH
ncbi:hypothetical protein AQ915_25900 [Burkholderia pseudomallei]|nr:hypothetical protein AQ915_25900 [Burkholderia pseudomallei]